MEPSTITIHKNPLSVMDTHLQVLLRIPETPELHIRILRGALSKLVSFPSSDVLTPKFVASFLETRDLYDLLEKKGTSQTELTKQREVTELAEQHDSIRELLGRVITDLTTHAHVAIPEDRRKLLKAPTEVDFPYHRSLCRTRVQSDLDGCEFVKLGDVSDGSMGFMVLVMVEKSPRIHLENPRQTLGRPILYPLDKVSYTVDNKIVAALLYPDFQPLSVHLRDHPDAMKQRTFQPVIKGIIQALIDLETNDHEPWLITKDTMIVREGNMGGLLCTCQRVQKHPNEYWTKCFVDAKNCIKGLHKSGALHPELKTLLKCMELADSSFKRLRLLRAPYFLSPSQKMLDFIHKAHLASENCEAYTLILPQFDIYCDWKLKVIKNCIYPEMTTILSRGRYNGLLGTGFLHFLRDCVMHFVEVDTDLKKAVVNIPKKEEKGWENDKNKSLCILLVHPELFLGVINDVEPNFLDTVFLCSYMIDDPFILFLDEKEKSQTDILEGA